MPVNYVRVGEVSVKVMEVCKRYDPNMYVAGCDEGYIKYFFFSMSHLLLAYPYLVVSLSTCKSTILARENASKKYVPRFLKLQT